MSHNVHTQTFICLYCYLQECPLSHKSSVTMKVDVPEEETASYKNEGSKARCSTVTHSLSSAKPIFGGSGKLGI
jgi:DNA repair photolyase